jgi:hypothetical protein
MPAQAKLDSDISLVVRITAAPPETPDAVTAPLARLPQIKRQGTPVTVVVHTPAGLAEEIHEQVIWLLADRDPDPVRFGFRTLQEGLHRIRLTAWAGGSFLCELSLEVSVATHSPSLADSRRLVADLGSVRAEPGEVTLQIIRSGDRYVFQLISDAYLGLVHAEALIADPGAAVERAITTLRALATGRSGYAPANARRWMQEVGVGLWNDMVPDVIKEEFWRLRGDIATFSIAAGDGVPWELLYPKAPGHDEGFLLEQFPVLRRAHGQGRARSLCICDPRFIVSASVPSHALAEIDAIRGIVGEGAVIDDLAGLLQTLDGGDPGLLHFACHNAFSPATGSVIELDGGPFEPGLLNSAVAQRSLSRRSPLVFINACRTAGAVPEYTQMVGWAQRFMAAGVGAFIGTLWAVRSDSAATFAHAFYEQVADGTPLGQAALQARLAARADGVDPTWLAYSVYGDPAATAAT